MTADQLPVHLYGTHVGNIEKVSDTEIIFSAVDAGLDRFGVSSKVLSESLPLGATTSPTAATAFFGGLLPEGKGLRNLAREAKSDTKDVYALMSYAGKDVAGALQVRAEIDSTEGHYEPASDEFIAEKFVKINDYALGAPGGGGSLPGYQPKTTLARIDGQWLEATGGAATTHILKPSLPKYVSALHAEAYSLELGRRTGLTTFASEVRYFAGTPALIIERYDRRIDSKGLVHRIHQEDGAQAISLPWDGNAKFETEEPFRATMVNISSLLPRRRDLFGGGIDDRESLLAYMTFNVAIGNTDAHAKNFSFLHGEGGEIELAPLYDVAPLILNAEGTKYMAIKINGERFQPFITREDLVSESVGWGLEEGRVLSVVNDTLEQIRHAVEDADASDVDPQIPLLIANQSKNLLNGKRAAVNSDGPVILTKMRLS